MKKLVAKLLYADCKCGEGMHIDCLDEKLDDMKFALYNCPACDRPLIVYDNNKFYQVGDVL